MKKKWIVFAVIIALIIGVELLYALGPISGPMPTWLSIMPPLIAIVIALLLKEVISALFFGILAGTFIMNLFDGQSPLTSLGNGMLRVVDTYITGALFNNEHTIIIIFTILIGGMVRIISANGGMHAIVNWLMRRAKSPRSGQLITFLMDICMFFDDYSNTLMVGNTMRPVADKLKVSRQKLAYIVDSTAAPVVSIAFVTTWIGAELSYINAGIEEIGMDASAYVVFFRSLKYSFYPILTLGFVLMIILSQRDFGPMLKAEREARLSEIANEESVATNSKVAHGIDAVLPLAVLIFCTIAGLFFTGYNPEIWNDTNLNFIEKLSSIIGQSDSFTALMWASLLSLLTAIIMTVMRGSLPFGKIMEEMMDGFKMMFNAVIILTMAWAISLVTRDIHTAQFVSDLLLKLSLSPMLIPVLTFLLGALISFSTGTSWGTMAILYPLILPASWALSMEHGLSVDQAMPLFYNVVASVMAGSVMGDHCSPISDTTIMSSLASGCNHLQHVKTQMPYALTVGTVALLLGVFPTALGMPSWAAFLMGFVALYLIIRFFGQKVD
jgi:Na+/H+ antiporter NhaC